MTKGTKTPRPPESEVELWRQALTRNHGNIAAAWRSLADPKPPLGTFYNLVQRFELVTPGESLGQRLRAKPAPKKPLHGPTAGGIGATGPKPADLTGDATATFDRLRLTDRGLAVIHSAVAQADRDGPESCVEAMGIVKGVLAMLGVK